MKLSIKIVIIALLCIICSNQPIYVYAAPSGSEASGSTGDTGGTSGVTDEDWVKKAFSAAYDFLNEPVQDEIGISSVFEFFKSIIKAINRVLLVLLSGISILALSITGVRFMASGADPKQKTVAMESLKTIFKGMTIGFGAYVIWRIAMSIVTIVIGSFQGS